MEATRRRYSDEERAAALSMLDANGGNIAKTARDAGIPRITLLDWAAGRVSDSVSDIRQVKKADLAGMFEDFICRVLRLTTDEDIQGASLKDRFVAAGIASDKSLLLRGEPTEIVKSDASLLVVTAGPDDAARAERLFLAAQGTGDVHSDGGQERVDT